jgi:CRP/FNR family transcriptional regulator, anaerobic regulatory protein
MLFEIMEKNKSLLQGTGSYLLPRLDKIIDLLHTVETSAADDFFNAVRHVEFAKGDFFVREGTVCRNLLLLEKGSARQFINKNGVEPIICFSFPGEFIVSYKSFEFNKPANVNIQFVTDASGYSMSWANLTNLKLTYPSLGTIEKLALECRTYWLEERMCNIMFTPSRERYHYLLCYRPMLFQHFSLTNIASYLGISPETLSRIRSKTL